MKKMLERKYPIGNADGEIDASMSLKGLQIQKRNAFSFGYTKGRDETIKKACEIYCFAVCPISHKTCKDKKLCGQYMVFKKQMEALKCKNQKQGK